MSGGEDYGTGIDFTKLIKGYATLQKNLMDQIDKIAADPKKINPAEFILLQFNMAQATQAGESLSNVVAQANSVINNTVRNQKTQ